MCGHPDASGTGEDKTAAQSASLFAAAPMLGGRCARSALMGPTASFGPYSQEVLYRTLTCKGC
jgi:hypothetical protein